MKHHRRHYKHSRRRFEREMSHGRKAMRTLHSQARRAFGNRGDGGPYRSRSGMILGVCKGIAKHYDFSLFWMRFLTVAAALISGFWPILFLYLLAALLMKREPVLPLENESEQEFYTSYTASRAGAIGRLKRTYETLERRLRRLEDSVTAREYDWQRRFNEGN